ncbi:MAG: RNA-guided pseudouridylation complex pseudouridine synthase subunit Cbf5 [Thaumarchaeota archaeon]|nr:RNA-guided pseudouridylation complex pseudouridine synthase subunit Cbf5 [Candidatus Calditenuaceae archaeon]MDW8042045.1 RNA-guided pseudouridylation complex pseudouridine synthase subunit Cbf5 [Nitrososphaerota archaeon]
MTGVLPVMLGRATRLTQAIAGQPKEYVCLMRLHDEVRHEELFDALREFVGEIYQTPPIRSRVARRPRIRVVYELEVLELEGRDVLFRALVSGGTYLRKLCHDLGLLLGVGAHMVELRRTRSGPVTEDRTVSLLELFAAVKAHREGDTRWLEGFVRNPEELVAYLPRVEVLDTAVDAVCHGAPLAVAGIARLSRQIEPGDLVAVHTLKGELIALGRAEKSALDVEEGGVFVRTDVVLMDRGTYPSYWKGKWRSQAT